MFLLTGFVKITWRFKGRMVNRWLFTHNKVRRQCGYKIVCEPLTYILKTYLFYKNAYILLSGSASISILFVE